MGGGSGGGGTPTIQYTITFLRALEISSIDIQVFGFNNFCDVVGKFADGFRYVAYVDTEETGMVSVESLLDPDDVFYEGVGVPGISGWALSSADAINDLGQIVGRGWFENADGSWGWQGFRASPPEPGDTYWTIEALGDVRPLAINNSGDVTGPMHEEDGYHAFLYTDEGGLQDLGTLPNGDKAWPEAITNRDSNGVIRIAGGYRSLRAFRYTTGGVGYEDLGTLKSDDTGQSRSMAMNDDGDVVGWAVRDPKKGDGAWVAFHYSNGDGMVSLGTLTTSRTWNDSIANDVNGSGEVIGGSMTEFPDWRAFYWTAETGMLKVEDLITNLPDDAVDLISVGHINELGEICGVFPGSSTRPRQVFIFTPVPPEN